MHNFRPHFSLKFTEIYDYWWSQGAALLFIRECIFGGTKNAQLQFPYLSKFICIYDFGDYKGEVPSLPKKILYLVS